MMKRILVSAIIAAASINAYAESNVTLYGVIDQAVAVTKHKHEAAKVRIDDGIYAGSRFGIKGTEDLGGGTQVFFNLDQAFLADNGSKTFGNEGKAFSREAFMYVNGGFGKLGFGRTGALSFAQSNAILTGWAFGTGYGLSSWTSAIGNNFSRMDNVVSYATPVFDGFSVHAMYSNGLTGDSEKWSDNNHYYGIGVKYQANAIRSSLIFEAADNKGTATADTLVSDVLTENQWNALKQTPAWSTVKDDVVKAGTAKKKALYVINYGFEYNLGSWTPMFAYQFAHQNQGRRTHMFGLSAKADVAGGNVMIGARYLFGKDKATKVGASELSVDGDVRAWNIGAAYVYPLSKRTALKAFAGYADSGKEWKNVEAVGYNG